MQRDHERLAQYLEDEKLFKHEVVRYQEGYHDLENRLASAKLNEGGTIVNRNIATIKEKDPIELRLEWHDAGAPDRVWAYSCQLLGWLTIL